MSSLIGFESSDFFSTLGKSEQGIIPAWNEIEQQFTQGPSSLPLELKITLTFNGNMTQTTLKDISSNIQTACMDAFDQYFNQSLLSFIWQLIPTRSGKLADLIMQSIFIYKTSNSRTFIFNIPQGYPPSITNPKHNGEIDYGKKYTPTYTSPLIQKIRDTSKGAYYLLSDPIAEPNYLVTIQNYIYSSMYQLLTYIESVNFIAIASIRIQEQNVIMRGRTTTKSQSGFGYQLPSKNGNNNTYTSDIIFNADQYVFSNTALKPEVTGDTLSKIKDLWNSKQLDSNNMNYNQLGDVIMSVNRRARYIWNFTFIFKAKIVAMNTK